MSIIKITKDIPKINHRYITKPPNNTRYYWCWSFRDHLMKCDCCGNYYDYLDEPVTEKNSDGSWCPIWLCYACYICTVDNPTYGYVSYMGDKYLIGHEYSDNIKQQKCIHQVVPDAFTKDKYTQI